MLMKTFVKSAKDIKKIELATLIIDDQIGLIEEYVKSIHKPKYAEAAAYLYDRIMTAKMVKGFKMALKEYSDVLDPGWAIIIADAIDNTTKREKAKKEEDRMNEDDLKTIMEEYASIVEKLLKPFVKKIAKKSDIKPIIIQEMLLVAPSADYISGERYTGVYSRKMCSKLYGLTKSTDPAEYGISGYDELTKLFGKIFGKDLLRWVALEVLLERKEGIKGLSKTEQKMWGLLTDFALDTIESLDKELRIETLKNYCKRRFQDNKNQKDSARRVNLSAISEEDYPKTLKAVKKLSKDDEVAKWF